MLHPVALSFFRKRHVVVFLMLIAGLGWAVSAEFARHISRDTPVQQLVWGRYFVHLLVLLLFIWPKRRSALWSTAKPARHIVRGLMMLAMPGLFVFGAASLSPNDMWALAWLAPVISVGIGAAMLGEKPSIGSCVATALGFLGVQIFYGSSPNILSQMVALLPIGSALAFAVFQVLSREMRDEATSTGIFYTALCVVVPLTFVPGTLSVPSLADATYIVGMGLSWLAVLVTIDEALKRAPLGVVAPLLYSSLLWKILVGWLLFGDSITPRELTVALLVAAGCGVAVYVCARLNEGSP